MNEHCEFFPSQSDSKIEPCCPNFDPCTSSHFDSFWKKRVSLTRNNCVWLTQILPWLSYWVKLTRKTSIDSGDSVFESIYQPSQNWVRLTQIRQWLSFLVNWLENWVTRNNANFFDSTWLSNWVMVDYESNWLVFLFK